jgi:hypothetical protein
VQLLWRLLYSWQCTGSTLRSCEREAIFGVGDKMVAWPALEWELFVWSVFFSIFFLILLELGLVLALVLGPGLCTISIYPRENIMKSVEV